MLLRYSNKIAVLKNPEGKTPWFHFLSHLLSLLLRPVDIIRHYEKRSLSADFAAGITVAVLMLPQSLAFAQIANLPPQYGLYTAMVASFFGALWGSSVHLQTGPTNTSSLLILSILLPIARPDSPDYLLVAGMLAFITGLFRFSMGVARFGVLVNFISDSVIIGFTVGAELLIIIHQLRHLLRIDFPESLDLPTTVAILWDKLPATHGPTLALGVLLFILIAALQRIHPKLPSSLVVIAAAATAVAFLDLQDMGIRVVGKLERGIPPFVKLPLLDVSLWRHLSAGAFALASIGLVEASSIARSLAAKSGQKLDSNQEFIGQGMANMACGLFSGYPCSGSFTRSLVNLNSGARTPLCNVFAALILLLFIQALAPYVVYIPLSALAAVVIVNASKMTQWTEIKRIWSLRQNDRVIMMVTLLATLSLSLHMAVMIGIALSLALYLKKTSTPRIREVLPNESFENFIPQKDRPGCPQLAIVEILGDFYFGAAHYVEEKVIRLFSHNPERKYLLLRMQNVEQCDISGIHALESIAKVCRERKGEMFLARLRQPVMEVMQSAGFIDKLGDHCFLIQNKNAIKYLFYRVLDPSVCIYECPERAFQECQNLPKNLIGKHTEWRTAIPSADIPTIEPKELWESAVGPNPPIIIDVREQKEYRQGHLPHSKLVPLPVLLSSPHYSIGEGRIVLVCRDQRRSNRAAAILLERGHTHVFVLRGGLQAWESSNLLMAF